MKRYSKDGQIKTRNQIVVRKDGMQIINPSEELILADGWVEYVAPEPTPRKKSRMEVVQELVIANYNSRTDITNNEALDYMVIIYPWSKYIGQNLEEGRVLVYEDKPYRVRQAHTVLEVYPPSLDTAALYEAINYEHEGTLEDPIPYNPPMEIFVGKYYVQGGVTYKCTRDSGTALSHDLSALVGLYVEEA